MTIEAFSPVFDFMLSEWSPSCLANQFLDDHEKTQRKLDWSVLFRLNDTNELPRIPN